MASPVTQTDIVNGAAALLGSSERVTSIDGDSTLARHAKATWDATMRALLADHPWNFAIKRATLNVGTAPVFGYDYTFALPADCLRFLSAVDADGDEIEALCEGGLLLTDSETVNVRYLSSEHVTGTSHWPPHLCKAAEYALAAALAEALTSSESVASRMRDEASDHMRRARRVDGLESQDSRQRNIRVRSNFLQATRPNRRWQR